MKSIFNGDYSLLPSLNEVQTLNELKNLHHKLVRYNCVVQDMYEEEIYQTEVTIPAPNEEEKQKIYTYKYHMDLPQEL